MMSEYGKKESVRIKGIAIIYMFALHFFAHPDWIEQENMYVTLTNNGADILLMLSNFGHICVALFAFTSGYAMYVQREKYNSFEFRAKKCFSFIIQYWFVVVAFIAVGMMMREPMPDMPVFILQSFGIGTDVYAEGMNVCTAWYVAFFIVFVLLHPVLKKVSVKNFGIDSIVAFVVLYGGSMIITKQPFVHIPDAINRFLERFGLWGAIGMIGYIFAKYDMFRKVDTLLTRKLNSKVIVVMAVVIIPVMVIVRAFSGNIAITDIVYAPILIYAVNCILNRFQMPRVENGLVVLAKYSMYMWFLHSIFFTPNNSLQWLAYFPKFPFFILVWTLIITLIVSMLFSKIYDLIKRLKIWHGILF